MRRLLDAAIEVFDTRGYHGARVDDICAVANTSHGTFYLYFSSKEDLFRALVDDVSSEMVHLAEAMPPITPDAAGYAALRSWLGAFYDGYRRFHPVIRAWMDTQVGTLDLGRMGAGVLGAFTEALETRIGSEHAATTALAAVALVERFCFYSVIQIVPLSRDQVLDTMASILHKGVFAATG
jgi:AcrR family transcriptional regulator